jgi:ribosomal protein S18 acetylase RimI-like enzyme
MTAALLTARDLTAADLDRVVEIDAAGAGRARPAFYARRLASATDVGSDLGIGVDGGGELLGFVFARVLDGEFGGVAPVGVLDALAVAPADRRSGTGRTLLDALADRLRARGAVQLRTQASWTERDLVSFFAVAGFTLAPQLVLERSVEQPFDDDFDADLSIVHTLAQSDLPAIVRIDTRVTGRDRGVYYHRLVDEALHRSGVRVSLVAEVDGRVAGYLMARVDYGDFGLPEPTAVLDTIGVDPDLAGGHLGRTLLDQLLINLRSLRVEVLRTEVDWSDLDLLAFLHRTGFLRSGRLAFGLELASPAGRERGAR